MGVVVYQFVPGRTGIGWIGTADSFLTRCIWIASVTSRWRVSGAIGTQVLLLCVSFQVFRQTPITHLSRRPRVPGTDQLITNIFSTILNHPHYSSPPKYAWHKQQRHAAAAGALATPRRHNIDFTPQNGNQKRRGNSSNERDWTLLHSHATCSRAPPLLPLLKKWRSSFLKDARCNFISVLYFLCDAVVWRKTHLMYCLS